MNIINYIKRIVFIYKWINFEFCNYFLIINRISNITVKIKKDKLNKNKDILFNNYMKLYFISHLLYLNIYNRKSIIWEDHILRYSNVFWGLGISLYLDKSFHYIILNVMRFLDPRTR